VTMCKSRPVSQAPSHLAPLMLYIAIALGTLLGRCSIYGYHIGGAAVLFTGIVLGNLVSCPIPDALLYTSLATSVYCLGLLGAAELPAIFTRKGMASHGVGLLIVCFVGVALVGITLTLGLSPTAIAGSLTGALSASPALANLLGLIANTNDSGAAASTVIAYFSIAYPASTIGFISAVFCWEYLLKSSPHETRLVYFGKREGDINSVSRSIVLIAPEFERASVAAVVKENQLHVRFGRIKVGETLSIVRGDTILEPGALISVIGSADQVAEASRLLGAITTDSLPFDEPASRTDTYVVSNPAICSIPLHRLSQLHRIGANILRIRRGDAEFIPSGEHTLALGDLAQVAAPREHYDQLESTLGNRADTQGPLSLVGLSLGIVAGLLVGALHIPLKAGPYLNLGVVGGPLLAGLLFGTLKRTGPIIWAMSPAVNGSLRVLCLNLFLAGTGIKAGPQVLTVLATPAGIYASLLTGVVVFLVIAAALGVLHHLMKVPVAHAIAMLAGFQSSPALLGFIQSRYPHRSVTTTYAANYPIMMLVKILTIQGVYLMLN
jgi:putative transport protein